MAKRPTMYRTASPQIISLQQRFSGSKWGSFDSKFNSVFVTNQLLLVDFRIILTFWDFLPLSPEVLGSVFASKCKLLIYSLQHV